MNLPLMLERSLTTKDGSFQHLDGVETTFKSLIQISKIATDGPLAAQTTNLDQPSILKICETIIKKPNSWPIINFLLKNKEIPIADIDIYERRQKLESMVSFSNVKYTAKSSQSTSVITQACFFGLAILSRNLEAVKGLLAENPNLIYSPIFLGKEPQAKDKTEIILVPLSMVDKDSKQLLSKDITSQEIYDLIRFRVQLEMIAASTNPSYIINTISDLFKNNKAFLIDTFISELPRVFKENYMALFNVIQQIRCCFKHPQQQPAESATLATLLQELSDFEQKILPKLKELPKNPVIDDLIKKLDIKSTLPIETRYEKRYGIRFHQKPLIDAVPAAGSETTAPAPAKP